MKDRKVNLNVNVDAEDYAVLASRCNNVSDLVRRGVAAFVNQPSLLADVVAHLVESSKHDDQSKQ